MWPPRDAAWVWKVIHLLITLVRPLFCHLRIEGRDNIPRTGGYVLTCNHTMGPDFFVIGYASPHQIYFMAKQELFEVNPLLTWIFNQCGVFPIRRGETDMAAVNHAISLVKSGHVLGMFPEGTRSRTGKLQRGRSGAARIAIQAQAPVVPAYVVNAAAIFRRTNWLSLKPRAIVTVRFGAPLSPPVNPDDSRGLRQYTRQIMQSIGDLAQGDSSSHEQMPAAEDLDADAPKRGSELQMRFPKEGTPTWKLLYVVAIIIKPFFLRLNIEGEENLPLMGGCVIACNHTLGGDYVVLGYASPRQVYYMAKAEIFAIHPLLAKLVTGAGAFPVQRGKGDTQAIEQAVAIVKAGNIVGMFPEGTRSRSGVLRQAKPGAARIALGAGAPIVPAAVINGETILRDFVKFQRRPLVTVRFGAQFMPAGDANNPEDVQRVTTAIMLAIAELLPSEKRGYYADPAALLAESEGEGVRG